ncbi:MAG: VUT family protein [Hyphomonadaceae bacterium]
MVEIWNSFISALTNGQPNTLIPVLIGLTVCTAYIWELGGRGWALFYVAVIPFLNWSFAVVPDIPILGPGVINEPGVSLHPLTLVTGFVFVARDFVQREMGHKVLIVMAIAIGWAFFYAWPVIVIASGTAFAISEIVDWALFTFTKYKLSTRILLSSALATPIDTTIFLYGADLARQMALGEPEGNSLHLANWIVFVIGKMIGALIVSRMVKKREDAGFYDDEPADLPEKVSA